MYFGSYILALATLAIALSAAGYLAVASGKENYALASRWFYYLGVGLVIAASAYLLGSFLNNRFEFAYISGYSSNDLSTNYKVTSFWAGQEGSFLLWALFGVLLGLWVKSKAKEQLGWVMFFYLMAQLFLFALLNISSPFKLNQVIPPDGSGLNPLLQNFWMQIHPPIVFLGYAATFVPFAFAMAALATNKYDSWGKLAFPWAIFSVCSLGAGIFLGGYWAYETLGWGGYWSWDPVENASLVPWLGSIALVHGMILERHKGTFRKTNLFLAITTFLMVIYGTFLTRSGVLADFSLHSFVDLGMTVYLAIFLIAFTVISYGLWIYRAKSIATVQSGKSALTIEFTVYLGMLFLILSAFLVLLGMSSPLITRLFGDPSAVDISFYVITNLPIAILIGVVLGLTGVINWQETSRKELLRKLLLPVIIALVMALIAIIYKIYNLWHLLFIFTSGFAFIANIISLVKRFKRRGWEVVYIDIIHVGLGLMLIGIIISSAYGVNEKTPIIKDEPKSILGFEIIYKGITDISEAKQQANLVIHHGDSHYEANPIFIWSKQGLVRNPYIKKFLLYDLYISPEEIKTVEDSTAGHTHILTKGQMAIVAGYNITFAKFETGAHGVGDMMSIGAQLDITDSLGNASVITPVYNVTDSGAVLEPAKLPGSNTNVFLLKINADNGVVMIGLTEANSPAEFESSEALIVNISRKPLINFVWLGALMIIIGAAISMQRRIRQVQ